MLAVVVLRVAMHPAGAVVRRALLDRAFGCWITGVAGQSGAD